MDPSPPQKLTEATNELAKERNRAAAERTLSAWMGQCIGLVGVGIASHQIVQSLQRQFPEVNWAVSARVAYLIGLAFVTTGLILLIIALIQHRLELKSIEQENYVLLPISRLNRVAVAAIVLFGASGFLATLVMQ